MLPFLSKGPLTSSPKDTRSLGRSKTSWSDGTTLLVLAGAMALEAGKEWNGEGVVEGG